MSDSQRTLLVVHPVALLRRGMRAVLTDRFGARLSILETATIECAIRLSREIQPWHVDLVMCNPEFSLLAIAELRRQCSRARWSAFSYERTARSAHLCALLNFDGSIDGGQPVKDIVAEVMRLLTLLEAADPSAVGFTQSCRCGADPAPAKQA
ncbi:hypothetical protein [Piscinibacter sp.]|uniref:hypothetical protein n=1 Tax=Piscinibacter sp. TaxID=1903157 RepID=UPI002C0607E1|nr:hypothetical protein [Albitalea sp.]HUG22719.1 hypothetical protein [Albitalea sp.]